MSKTEILAVPQARETESDAPFPLFACWLIWIVAALALWALILSPFIRV